MTDSNFIDHFDTHFASLTDPRLDRKKQHSLRDILLLTILGVICGADSWTDVALLGQSRQDELKDALQLPNGILSHDTLGRVFSLLTLPNVTATPHLGYVEQNSYERPLHNVTSEAKTR